MPTYDYVCDACGHALEIFQSMSEAPKRKCPQCKKSKLARRIGAGAGFLFKGSGFYLTDYRSKAYTAQSEAERKGESGGTAPPDAATNASSATESGSQKADSKADSKGASKSDAAAKPKATASNPAPKKKPARGN